MRLEILNKLFKAENPTGVVVRNPQRGKNWYTVWFKSGSKGYGYNASSVYALAERLDLIPEIDVRVEAQFIMAMLKTQDYIVALAGSGDTCRYLWKENGTIMEACAGVDEFGRALSRYYVDHNDAWSCTAR